MCNICLGYSPFIYNTPVSEGTWPWGKEDRSAEGNMYWHFLGYSLKAKTLAAKLIYTSPNLESKVKNENHWLVLKTVVPTYCERCPLTVVIEHQQGVRVPSLLVSWPVSAWAKYTLLLAFYDSPDIQVIKGHAHKPIAYSLIHSTPSLEPFSMKCLNGKVWIRL